MTVLAAEMLVGELWRLGFSATPAAAVDLKFRHEEVRRWFAGLPVYGELEDAIYPPASYTLLWPLLGWLPLRPARWLWALTSILALGGLTVLVILQSRSETVLEQVFAGLTVLSMNAVGVAIHNGQLLLHGLPALLTAILLLQKHTRPWWQEAMAVLLLLFSLVKLSGTAPFLWVVLVLPRRWRPLAVVAAGYLAATLLAAQYQAAGLEVLLRQWLARSTVVSIRDGYGHLGVLCATIGVQDWLLPCSLTALAGLGIWIYVHRRCDQWVLLGVTAIIARIWTYHRLYDDVLMLFPIVTLLRIAKGAQPRDSSDVGAGMLLALMLATTLTPTRLFHSWPHPWPLLFSATHVIVWLLVLAFLLGQARRHRASQAAVTVGS
jgi:hypothetical protein